MKKHFAIAATAVVLVLPATAGAATVGATKVYPPVTGNSKGAAQAYRFTAQASGAVDRLNVYLDGMSTATQVTVGLYDGSASSASTRRATCVISKPVRKAWNRCSIPASQVTAGAMYWLALLQPAASTGSIE